MGRWRVVKDLVAFLRTERKYWLVPLVLILVALGLLLIFAQGSVVAPFIYTLY